MRSQTCPWCGSEDREKRYYILSRAPSAQAIDTVVCHNQWHTPLTPPAPAPLDAARDAVVFQRLADAVDEIVAKVTRGEAITALDAGKAHVALRAYQSHRAERAKGGPRG